MPLKSSSTSLDARCSLALLIACALMLPECDAPAAEPQTRAGAKISSNLRITGKATVLDAHTLRFEDGREVELNGVMDAPDLAQVAMTGNWLYPCGRDAADYLRRLIGERTVTFLAFGANSPWGNKPFGNAYAGEVFLQEAMVRNGWAISDHSGTTLAEAIAMEDKRGLWRGPFIPPGRWRKGERLAAETLPDTEAKAVATLFAVGGKARSEGGYVTGMVMEGEKADAAALEPLEHLPHLRLLHLENASKLTDAALAHVAGLINLTNLHISRAHNLTDAGLIHFRNLIHLKDLELNNLRSLTGSGLGHLTGLAELETLDFNHTPVTDEGLALLPKFDNLTTLGLRATKITDQGLAVTRKLPKLERLILWETSITDQGLELLGKVTTLKELLLVATEISSDGLKFLQSLPRLENVEIRHIKGDDDTALGHLAKLPGLKRLEFHDMKPTAAGLAHLGTMTHLEVLLIGGSKLPEGFVHLGRLTALKELNLWKSPISDEDASHLKSLKSLVKLYLSDTKITDASIPVFSKMNDLETLGLSEIPITDEGLLQISGLPKLRHVSLLHSRVTDAGVQRVKETRPQLDIYYR